jgi:putative transposase
LQADLADNGIRVGVHRIKRIRKKLGLRCRQKRKFKATTDSRHNLPVAPNLLGRQFSVSAPNQAWVTDITYSTPRQRSPPARGLSCLSMTGMHVH